MSHHLSSTEIAVPMIIITCTFWEAAFFPLLPLPILPRLSLHWPCAQPNKSKRNSAVAEYDHSLRDNASGLLSLRARGSPVASENSIRAHDGGRRIRT